MSPILSRLFYFGMIVLLGSCAGKNAFISKSILKDEYFKKIASNPDHEVQIIYTQVNKKDNSFKSFTYNVDNNKYFYPEIVYMRFNDYYPSYPWSFLLYFLHSFSKNY